MGLSVGQEVTETPTESLPLTVLPEPAESPTPLPTELSLPTATLTDVPLHIYTETPVPTDTSMPLETPVEPTAEIPPVATLLPTPMSSPMVLLAEDAENETSLWTTSGTWARANEVAHQGTSVWSDSPGSVYAPSTVSVLSLAQPLVLPSNAYIQLQYWQYLALGVGDSTQVQLSLDNVNWTPIATEAAVRNLAWTVKTVNLSGYGGQTLWLRFVLSADADPATVDDGWRLDDILVKAEPLPVMLRAGLNEAESDDPALWLTEGSWQAVMAPVYSGSTAWTVMPQAETAVALMLNADVSLAALAQPELHFWHILDVTSGADHAEVQLSTNGGQSWISLAAYAADANTSDWAAQSVSLSTYAGQTVRLRFLLVSDGDGVNGIGWTVDGVALAEAGSLLPTETPTPEATLTPTPLGPDWTTYEDTDPLLVYGSGTWQTYDIPAAAGGTLTTSSDPGATLTLHLEGTGIRVLHSKGPDGGAFSAWVDANPVQTVDGYAESYSYGHVVTFEGLPEGQHTLTITNGDGAIWIEAVQVHNGRLSILGTPTFTMTPSPTPPLPLSVMDAPSMAPAMDLASAMIEIPNGERCLAQCVGDRWRDFSGAKWVLCARQHLLYQPPHDALWQRRDAPRDGSRNRHPGECDDHCPFPRGDD